MANSRLPLRPARGLVWALASAISKRLMLAKAKPRREPNSACKCGTASRKSNRVGTVRGSACVSDATVSPLAGVGAGLPTRMPYSLKKAVTSV